MNDPLIRKTTLPFLIVSLLLLITHFAIIKSDVLANYIVDDWYWNYVFLVPVSLIGLGIVAHRFKKTEKITSIGKNYIAYTVLKMIFAIVFLLPWLLNKDESSKPMVIQFFAIFFPFLLVETILLIRLLNSPLGEKNKNEQNQGK